MKDSKEIVFKINTKKRNAVMLITTNVQYVELLSNEEMNEVIQ
jgi:hypothetical protein